MKARPTHSANFCVETSAPRSPYVKYGSLAVLSFALNFARMRRSKSAEKNKNWSRVALLTVMMAFAVGLVPVSVGAVNLNPICEDGGLSNEQKDAAGCDVKGEELTNQIPVAVNVILWIAGILAVVMIIYSGLQMMISSGDSSKTETAKKTLTYAVVGLVVVMLSYVIVGFVVGQFGGGGDQGSDTVEVIEENGRQQT